LCTPGAVKDFSEDYEDSTDDPQAGKGIKLPNAQRQEK
jgi:hypothetical protein